MILFDPQLKICHVRLNRASYPYRIPTDGKF